MAANQGSTASTAIAGSLLASTPAIDESHILTANSNADHDGSHEAKATLDRKLNDNLDTARDTTANTAARSQSKKTPKSRHKRKVLKRNPPAADIESSDDDSSDTSENAHSLVDSESENESTTDLETCSRGNKSRIERGHKAKKSKSGKKGKAGKVSKKQAKDHPSKNKAAPKSKRSVHESGSDSESSDSSNSSSSGSESNSPSSDSFSPASDKDRKRRKKRVKRSRRPNVSDTRRRGDANDRLQNIEDRFHAIETYLAQLVVQQTQPTAQTGMQFSSLGLGETPTSYPVPKTTILPEKPPYKPLVFAETNVIDNSGTLSRSSRPQPGRKVKSLRNLGSQLPTSTIEIDDQGSDSLSSSKNRKKGNMKKGTKVDFKRVDWVWDSSLYTWKLQDSTEPTSDSQYEEYIFHVRRIFDIEGRYRSTTVDIKSKLLRECLQDVIGDVKGVSLVDESPKTDPNMLFLYLEDLRAHRKELKRTQPVGSSKRERRRNQRRLENKRQQLKVLISYLDKDYSRTKESLYPMLENGLITFELMWALWKPGTLAFTSLYGSTEDPRVFKVELAERHKSFMKGELYHLDGKYFEFDGKKFGQGTVSDEILAFRGARKITSLPCYPLKYHPDEKRLRERLIERGKKFVSLSGVHYKSYSGMAYQKSKKCVIKFNIQQSRVMVDPAIFRRINPNYYVSPVKAHDDSLAFGDGMSDDEGDSEPGISGSSIAGHVKAMRARKLAAALFGSGSNGTESDMSLDIGPGSPVQGLANGTSTYEVEGSTDDKPLSISDDEYLMASPVVLGFAFSEKQWLEFTVDSIRDIVWNDTAWDSLVSEPETKDLVQALVKSRKYHAANTIDDVIQGKGKGLVTVLHGPPGTGKTLTAEGISELLKCPLYMASAGELGTDSRFLEAELQKILDICHAWGAILLLDEADVFLEKRTMLDIHRNALVSIFLRQLEYFQGILFLTTNRVETFDEAFQSRIHIALRYGALEPKAKKAIFKMFIDKVRNFGKMKVADFSEEELDALARKELNGREIKNVVSSAQDLAVNKDEALSMAHIKQVLDVHAKFGRDLKGGSGFEDAMRSYF